MFELTPLLHVLVAANLAWAVGFTARRHGWDWTRCAGLALIAFPFFHLALQAATAVPRINAGLALAPLTDLDILRNVLVALLFRVAFPVAGLLLVFGWNPRALGRFLALPRLGLRADAEAGQALFGFVALLYGIGFYAVPRFFDSGSVSQAAAPLARVSVLGAVLLSLAAGLGEELLFRGVLQRWLLRRLPWSIAVAAQSLLFGLSHLTYGSLLPVLASTALGLLTGLVAFRLGLLAAILLHAQLDLLHFALDLQDPVLLLSVLCASLLGLLLLVAQRARSLRLLLAPMPAWNERAKSDDSAP